MKSHKKKKNENKKFSELNQCQCQTMSGYTEYQSHIMSESS